MTTRNLMHSHFKCGTGTFVKCLFFASHFAPGTFEPSENIWPHNILAFSLCLPLFSPISDLRRPCSRVILIFPLRKRTNELEAQRRSISVFPKVGVLKSEERESQIGEGKCLEILISELTNLRVKLGDWHFLLMFNSRCPTAGKQ